MMRASYTRTLCRLLRSASALQPSRKPPAHMWKRTPPCGCMQGFCGSRGHVVSELAMKQGEESRGSRLAAQARARVPDPVTTMLLR